MAASCHLPLNIANSCSHACEPLPCVLPRWGGGQRQADRQTLPVFLARFDDISTAGGVNTSFSCDHLDGKHDGDVWRARRRIQAFGQIPDMVGIGLNSLPTRPVCAHCFRAGGRDLDGHGRRGVTAARIGRQTDPPPPQVEAGWWCCGYAGHLAGPEQTALVGTLLAPLPPALLPCLLDITVLTIPCTTLVAIAWFYLLVDGRLCMPTFARHSTAADACLTPLPTLVELDYLVDLFLPVPIHSIPAPLPAAAFPGLVDGHFHYPLLHTPFYGFGALPATFWVCYLTRPRAARYCRIPALLLFGGRCHYHTFPAPHTRFPVCWT